MFAYVYLQNMIVHHGSIIGALRTRGSEGKVRGKGLFG